MFRFGLTDQCTRVTGWTTKPTAKVVSFMQTGTYTMAIGRMIRHMARAFTVTSMERAILDSGRKTSSMEKVLKRGLMEPAMTVNMLRVKNTDEVASRGQTTALIQVTSLKTISRAKVS